MNKIFLCLISLTVITLNCRAVEQLVLSDVIKEARDLQMQKQISSKSQPAENTKKSCSDVETKAEEKCTNISQNKIK